MASRLSTVAGLLTGVVVALALLAGFVFVGPDPARPSPSSSASAPAAVVSPSGSAGPSASSSASALASAAASESTSPVASGSETTNFHVGQPAPSLVVPQVGGGTIDLASMKGSPVWINFMQTTCPPCIDEFPLMNSFAVRYADKGLIVVAIDIREEEGTVAEFAQGLNATFPLGLDTNGAAQQAWGAYGLPVHFWIDREGIVRDGGLGGIGPEVMARGVGTILPGVTVTP
jgi:cytochrome c biogenesis protein CcmG, thiol:disulfide interchange protein DsbE